MTKTNDPVVKGEPDSPRQASSSSGIAKNRGCTDILCFLIYFAHIGFFCYLAYEGFSNGDWRRVVLPQDYASRMCGSGTNITNNLVAPKIALSDYSHMAFFLNVTSTIGEGALNDICGQKTTVLQIAGCEATTACGSNLKKACDGRKPAIGFEPEKFKDPKGLGSWLVGNGASINPLDDFYRYIVSSCVSSCEDYSNFWNKTITEKDAPRQYVYRPDKNLLHAEAWLAWEKALTNGAGFSALVDKFTFEALPESACPYDAKFCVPLLGENVNEVLNRCMMTFTAVNDVRVPSKDNSTETDLTSKVTDALRDAIGSSLGDALATVATTWDVFIIVAVAALVIGIICLVILRFTAGLWIWASIFIFFFGTLSAGGYAFWYSTACKGADILEDVEGRISSLDVEGKACEFGYLEPGESLRTTYRYVSFGVFGVAGLFLLIICCLQRQIREAVSLNKVAARFIACNKTALLVPVIQILTVVIWWALWFFVIAFVVSNVHIVDGVYSYHDAFTSPDKPGNCTSTWPTGTPWQDLSLDDCSCAGVLDCDPASLPCFKCGPPRFSVSWQAAYLFFSLLWNNAFIVAIGQMTLAGAVAVWYFNHGRGHYVTPVSTGLWNAFRYHLGTAAVGSFILALVQFIKWWLRFLAKQSQAQGNVVLARIAACLSYCVACFERLIKFLNKNAYIQCAISGRYVAVGAVTTMLQLLGILFITGGTGASGYFILKAIHPEKLHVAPWFCFAFYLIMGYVVSRLCMNVYSIAVSSALVCFIMDGERNSEPLHAPKEMLTFYKNRKSRLSHVSKK